MGPGAQIGLPSNISAAIHGGGERSAIIGLGGEFGRCAGVDVALLDQGLHRDGTVRPAPAVGNDRFVDQIVIAEILHLHLCGSFGNCITADEDVRAFGSTGCLAKRGRDQAKSPEGRQYDQHSGSDHGQHHSQDDELGSPSPVQAVNSGIRRQAEPAITPSWNRVGHRQWPTTASWAGFRPARPVMTFKSTVPVVGDFLMWCRWVRRVGAGPFDSYTPHPPVW